ncbi:AraC family transcriptional regulator [Chthoniobacter flavus]|uniref:AraC family transcriptional regulator n=1 Tax=Chthoniobacter flavus TaxID=191863 RepID=UPI00104EBF5F|nr:AraC family transcriptional regulator [Chthoniobacter flavus]TCO92482.1 AraC family transcriptional regulator [Chthoniobacter flavus]
MNALNLHRKFLRRIGSPEQLLRLFDLLPDVSFFMKDREGRFVALNRQGCDYCGVKSEREALGKTDCDFFPQTRAAEYMADDRVVMKTGRSILNRVEPAPEREGSPHLVITNKIPLRDGQGRVVGVAGFSRRVEQVRVAPAATKQLARAVRRLHDDYASPLTTGQLAQLAGLSPSQFERTFRKAFGASPRQYLLRVRVEAASRKLADTDKTIAAVAVECGFYDHAHFTRSFHAVTGISPSRYRREHQSPGL